MLMIGTKLLRRWALGIESLGEALEAAKSSLDTQSKYCGV
jgi:hypothetical protein